MLSKTQRGTILVYCLKKLYPQCVKRKNLFTHMDAEDLIEELGVHIWIALTRYRNKSYNDALKLAFTTGRNRLTSIVRTRMTVVKRGANAKFLPENIDDVYWLSSRGIYSNGVQVIDTLEMIGSTAIARVGVRRADSLVKALMYDWRRRPQGNQLAIMEALQRSRIQVRKMVADFIREIRLQFPSGGYVADDNLLEKVDGCWKSPREGNS